MSCARAADHHAATGPVILTTVAVAATAHAALGIAWAPAFVLGAVLAPHRPGVRLRGHPPAWRVRLTRRRRNEPRLQAYA